MLNDMIKGLFTLDHQCYVYGGYDPAVRWNGFYCPLFTEAEAVRLLNHYNEVAGHDWSYDADTDTFSIDEGGSEPELVKGKEVHPGVTMYPIGYQGWTWELVVTVPHDLLIEDGGLTDDTLYTVTNTETGGKLYIRSYEQQRFFDLMFSDLLTERHKIQASSNMVGYVGMLIPADLVEDWQGVYFPV